MPKTLPLFRSSTGLNVVSDPARIQYDPGKGVVDLQACVNMELDETGRLSRRKGFSPLVTGSLHSLFSCGEYALAAWNYSTAHYLIWLDSAGETGTLVELSRYNDRLCYASIGGRTYYSNGTELGYIQEKARYAWEAGDYVGKDSTRTVSDPPAGHLMEIAFGRMWVGREGVVHFSEPFAFNQFDMARCQILMQGKVTLLRSVVDGMVMSDGSGVYYYHGGNPKEMQVLKLSDYPAILGTDVPGTTRGFSLGLQDTFPYVLFMTDEGICAAGPQGRFYCLTEDKLAFPRVSSGSAVLNNNGCFLFLLNS